jgi:hypothetical protein
VTLSIEEQVERQRRAIARRDRPDFVAAVRIERDEHDLVGGTAEADLLVVVLDHEPAALRRRRQEHHERADHPVGLLGVLVRCEELPRSVDQQVVQLGPELRARGQPEVARDPLQLGFERILPVPVELDLPLADLPRIPHASVEQRLVTQPVARGMRHLAQLPGRALR